MSVTNEAATTPEEKPYTDLSVLPRGARRPDGLMAALGRVQTELDNVDRANAALRKAIEDLRARI